MDSCGFLGASPDGFVGSDAIIEVKCPFKYREAQHLRDVLDKTYFFYFNENSELVVNKEHIYYHQIQGQLYLTDKNVCHFYCWTPNVSETFEIEKDLEWEPNLNLLKEFYLTKYINYLNSA